MLRARIRALIRLALFSCTGGPRARRRASFSPRGGGTRSAGARAVRSGRDNGRATRAWKPRAGQRGDACRVGVDTARAILPGSPVRLPHSDEVFRSQCNRHRADCARHWRQHDRVFDRPRDSQETDSRRPRRRPRHRELGERRRQRPVAQQLSRVSPFSRAQRNPPSVGRRRLSTADPHTRQRQLCRQSHARVVELLRNASRESRQGQRLQRGRRAARQLRRSWSSAITCGRTPFTARRTSSAGR